MKIIVEPFESPIGTLLLASDGGSLVALDLHGNEDGLQATLHKVHPSAEIAHGKVPAAIRRGLQAYFDGELDAIDRIPCQASGSEFQHLVWDELRRIPVGTTTSYGALAQKIGRAGASRAVGLANGSNPIGIVVPCHRVIGADGTLTGYGGGLARKRWLLQHEGVALRPEGQLAMDLG